MRLRIFHRTRYTYRAPVRDSHNEVRLRPARDVEVHVTFDGQFGCPLTPADAVVVTRSPRSLRLVRAPNRDFFAVLRTKLKWGESTARRR